MAVVRPLRLARLPLHNEYHPSHFCWLSLCDRMDSVKCPGVVPEVCLIVEVVKLFLDCLAQGFRNGEVRIWGL